jgi:hypothetical protein
MLTCAAVVPGAPVLVPAVASGAAPELDRCRDAVGTVVARLLADAPDVVVIVGSGERTVRHEPGARSSLASVGVDVDATLGTGADLGSTTDAARLPLSLSIGAWALRRGDPRVCAVRGLEVATREAPQVCLGAGAGLVDGAERVALLVVADGTARRGPTAPGYTDARADGFDAGWLRAVRDADAGALARLDPALADELMMAGRAPLQVLAGAAHGARWSGELLYADDPYGVQYAVGQWWPAAA